VTDNVTENSLTQTMVIKFYASHKINLRNVFNPLMGTLIPQSKGPLCRDTVIGKLAAVPPSPLLAIPNITAHPSTASIPTSYYSMWHC